MILFLEAVLPMRIFLLFQGEKTQYDTDKFEDIFIRHFAIVLRVSRHFLKVVSFCNF